MGREGAGEEEEGEARERRNASFLLDGLASGERGRAPRRAWKEGENQREEESAMPDVVDPRIEAVGDGDKEEEDMGGGEGGKVDNRGRFRGRNKHRSPFLFSSPAVKQQASCGPPQFEHLRITRQVTERVSVDEQRTCCSLSTCTIQDHRPLRFKLESGSHQAQVLLQTRILIDSKNETNNI